MTVKPDVLQSMGLQRVGHDLATERRQQAVFYYTVLLCFSVFFLCKIGDDFMHYTWGVHFQKLAEKQNRKCLCARACV